ncbi:MAG: TonB-dependent receptor [Chitinophagaceae bacterium]|nr:TonB-dependent receptor [Chitinophagaceae bacterium]
MRSVLLLISIFVSFAAAAQDSAFSKSLDEIVITATRTERKLGNVAIPTQIVSQKIIRASGSLRLNDILQEQTGIFITSGSGSGAVGGGVFGNGIQLQGLSPDHTMILLDGEPLIGRQGGVMDLSRFAIGNIKKIEIVKGPSSSLYGSEAMGGVINIITEPLQGKQFNAGIRSGSFMNTDVYASGNYSGKKTAVYFFANRNSSNGYELDKSTLEKTLDPFYNYTGHIKFSYRFSPKTKLIVNNRYFHSFQESFYAINSSKINTGGNGQTNDITINPVLTHKFSNKVSSQMRFLVNEFRFTQKLDSLSNNKQYYYDDFRQGFYRAENQTDIELNTNNTLTLGGGYTLQTVNTTRYREKKEQHLYYGFIQNEWRGIKNLIVIGGLRYDYNTAFKARLSPKLAINYKLNEKIKFNASYGAGFKAPDFRQLYLSFVNNAAEGYSIYGASEFSMERLQLQKQQGLIAQILPAAFQITTLKPEVSRGFNFGFQITPLQKFRAEVNFFRNDVDNLINYLPVAANANGTSVFSYVNINRAFTQGVEVNASYQLFKKINISGGYQFLETADKTILENIKQGKVFGRDILNGSARLMTKADYSGLLNRSKHMANLRLFYDDAASGWSSSLRFIYRSRFGVLDKDGNGFANMDEEFAPAILQVNATLSKQINKQFNIQAGINNVLNQTNARFMPNLPGRNFFIAIHYTFKK